MGSRGIKGDYLAGVGCLKNKIRLLGLDFLSNRTVRIRCIDTGYIHGMVG